MGVHRGEGLMGSTEDKGFHGSIEAKDLVHELEGAHAQLDIFGAAWTRRRRTLSDVMRRGFRITCTRKRRSRVRVALSG